MNRIQILIWTLVLASLATLLTPPQAWAASAPVSAPIGATNYPESRPGSGLFVHDPSTLVKCRNEYWLFSTGPGVAARRSKDLVNWEAGPRVFAQAPGWTTNAAPGFKGYFWAPDIIQLSNRFLLYYSVSKWGENSSAIGLATNPTLDPADPNFLWTDQGLVIQSEKKDDFNAIDPAVFLDFDGTLWLSFGSFWSGIKLVQLNAATGKRLAPDSPLHSLAYHPAIEAPCIYRRDQYYYLIVNWGLCCRGTNSTYNIRVGRSLAITGPYLDKNGVPMHRDAGSLLLETSNQFIGPGHAGVLTQGGTNWLSFHYYDGHRRGAATLALRRLEWDTNDWPVVSWTDSHVP
jgi:arabinan endo-1,5-alpha-L-arabinosidase